MTFTLNVASLSTFTTFLCLKMATVWWMWSSTAVATLFTRLVFPALWCSHSISLTVSYCLLQCINGLSCFSVSFLSANSIAWAILQSFLNVSSASVSSLFCIDSLYNPQTKRSHSASFKNFPKLQWVVSSFNATMYSAALSPSCCVLLWNLKRSAIVKGFDLRCERSVLFNCSRDLSLKASGDTKFFNSS